MMNKKDQPNLTSELLRAIHQTDEWDRIWMQDPAIREARAQLDAILDSIEPKELRDKLLDTTFNLTSVCEETAIRYGARCDPGTSECCSTPLTRAGLPRSYIA